MNIRRYVQTFYRGTKFCHKRNQERLKSANRLKLEKDSETLFAIQKYQKRGLFKFCFGKSLTNNETNLLGFDNYLMRISI